MTATRLFAYNAVSYTIVRPCNCKEPPCIACDETPGLCEDHWDPGLQYHDPSLSEVLAWFGVEGAENPTGEIPFEQIENLRRRAAKRMRDPSFRESFPVDARGLEEPAEAAVRFLKDFVVLAAFASLFKSSLIWR